MTGQKVKPPNAGKGRVKGVPNKVTRDTRQMVAAIATRMAEEVEGWIRRGSKRDPLGAAGKYLQMLEFHIPKLARTEITGKDGKPVTVQVTPPDQAL